MLDLTVLANWAQIVGALGTLLAALVAVFAARLSYRSAMENHETNEQMIRPRVAVSIKPTKASKNLIDLVVSNHGNGIARDISLSLSGDDFMLDHYGKDRPVLSTLRVFSTGIKLLTPHEERQYYIVSLMGRYEDLLAVTTSVNINYTGDTGKRYSDTFLLDFSSFSDSGWTDKNAEAGKNIAKELEQIRRLLQRRR